MSDNENSGNKRTHLVFAIAVLIGAIILLVVTEWASKKPNGSPPPEAPQSGSLTTPPSTSAASPFSGDAATAPEEPLPIEPGPTPVRAFNATPYAPPAPEGHAEVVAQLHSPATSPAQDLAILTELFFNYTNQLGETPVGNNAEITAALAGDNARGFAPLPAGHPSINADGELLDRWGTPYFFHQLSDRLMEIRSAGPDLRLHTADDILWPPEETSPDDETP